ncbi:MAG TPA: carboxypeptidase regulatory-like domain-containing protein [Thermoanaerobaculia bacterium]|nr:carboxypeptidase regulatory-like domain-containing protein [Thermoanaerobaculia bacterium]
MDLDRRSSVTGNVSAVGRITGGGEVTGTSTTGAPPLALPSLPTAAQARALANRVFETDTTFTNAAIDDIVFVAGNVHIRGSLTGNGTIIASGNLRFGGEPDDLPPASAPPPPLAVLALGNITVAPEWPVRGLLFAAGNVEIGAQAAITGVLVAGGEIHLKHTATLTFAELDTTPPIVQITSPPATVTGTAAPPIAVSYTDATSGVDPTTLHVLLDGTDIIAACQVAAAAAACVPPQPLAAGAHNLSVSVSDRAGNSGSASLVFTVVLEIPAPVVTLTAPTSGIFVRSSSITATGTITTSAPLASVTVSGQPVALQAGGFSTQVSLTPGPNVIVVLATDTYGNVGVASAQLTLDTTPPTLAVLQPSPGALINAASVQLTGQVSDDNGVAQVTVAGQQATINVDSSFQAQVPLAEGSNAIALDAFDLAGNETAQTLTLVRFSLPEVAITSPADLSYIATTTVTVSGTVSDPAATVSVNGQPATVASGGFTAPGVPLLEGGNVLTATATGATGHVNTATINVVRDLTPPLLAIAYPQNGATVFDPLVTVSGLVNDIVAGTVNASQATVTVNGQPAAVANRSFLATVALVHGTNVIKVQATDVSGNTSQAAVTVNLQAATVPRVALVAGTGQSAVIGTQLGAPLVAALLDATGQPIAGQSLFFRVRGNNGSILGGQRGVAVTTDASGHAAVPFTLGTRAGAGNQVVEAFAPGFAGPAAFQETALPGSPAFIVVDTGDQQVGIPGQPAPRPLVAVVTDSGYNRLGGVQVQFTTNKGQGTFANGQQTVTATTDSDGRAIVTFTLDPAEGISNNGVRAAIVGLSNSPIASFALSGRAAGDPAATTVSGVVLDNAQQPVPGVTVSILGTVLNAQTDSAGHFQLQAVPPGTVTLIVDGSTTQRPGVWPDLEYFVTVIPGRDNTVNMPIYLLPLDLAHGAQVSETVGATLTLPDVPGFALQIAPGSVTFPNGSRSGLVSVTVVHADRVPMVPNFGQQPRLIVTIQPAGARFDPPARLTLPNVDGLAPGSVTEMYSFDHDLGHFVSIGPATVSDDGTVVTANPGVGVIKAGWHCCGNPATSGLPFDCPDCKTCEGAIGLLCIPDPTQNGLPCKHDPTMICNGGDCVCPFPINFHGTTGGAFGDEIHENYAWDSSTGNLSDLVGCNVLENLTYPENPIFTWPPPYNGQTINKVPLSEPATLGALSDRHVHKPIVAPYVTNNFVVHQIFTYTCPCAQGALFLSDPIVRTISQRPDGKWKYVIVHGNVCASADPLP